jgi:YD repeat-containing protein
VSTGNTVYTYDAAGNIAQATRENKAPYFFSYNEGGLLQSKTIQMPEEFSQLVMVDKYNYSYWK